jgi:peptidase M23-like protein
MRSTAPSHPSNEPQQPCDPAAITTAVRPHSGRMRRLLLILSAFLAVAAVLAAPVHAAWLWPVRGDVITQYRNGSDPYAAGQHRGIDIAAPVGTPVVAAAGGEVLFAGTAGSSGLTVSVRTGDGFDSSYLHFSSLAVRAGTHVSAGERLGAVGTTGVRSATAPHLHFGVREVGTRHSYLDPLSLLPPAAPPPPAEPPRPAPAPAPAPLTPRPTPAPAPAPRGAPAPGRAPAPRGAPAPGRAPQAAPTPGRAPAPGGVPRPAPTPGRAPAPGGVPAPGRAPRPAPTPGRAPRPVPAPAPRHAPRPAPMPGRGPRPAPTPSRNPSPAPAPTAAPDGAPRPRAMSARASQHRSVPGAAPSPSSGPDFGWALACAGLLLAAGILGLTDDGRKTAARSRSRLAGALRPLLGRR